MQTVNCGLNDTVKSLLIPNVHFFAVINAIGLYTAFPQICFLYALLRLGIKFQYPFYVHRLKLFKRALYKHTLHRQFIN